MGDLATPLSRLDLSDRSGLSDRGHGVNVDNDISAIMAIWRNLWDPNTNPDGYVSLGVAENTLMHDRLAAYVEDNFTLPHRYLTYNDGGAGSRKLRTAIAKFLTRQLKPAIPFEEDHICCTNGCSSAIEHASFLLCDPGEVFLLGRPYYRAFLPDVELRPRAKVAEVPFGDIDPMSLEAVACYEEVINQCRRDGLSVKGLMLCHPHNPLGRCYPREVLVEYMKLCQKYRIHLVSDEIYALSVWENKEDSHPAPVPFVSASSIDTTGLLDPHLLHIIWGISKDFGANGLRLGCLISQANPDLINACGSLSLYSFASGLTDHMIAMVLEDEKFTDAYFEENSKRLSHNYSLASRFLREHQIAYAPGANAAFFIVADLGEAFKKHHKDQIADDKLSETVYQKLLDHKVFLVSSDVMGNEQPGWFRIVFSQSEEYVMEGLRRIVATIEGK